ncbi:MAG TPA: type IX secretion system sortase PorU [Candidatus Cloacimonadota bacterium]|nr:type IX secretion system sortase PorU [Candidatus Cloacimonadota bacterium]
MKNRFALILALVFLSLSGFAEVTVLTRSPSLITVSFTIDAYNLSDTGDFQALSSSEMSSRLEVGAPDIPYSEFKVGIPFGAVVKTTVEQTTQDRIALVKRLRPIPRVIEADGISQNLYAPDPIKYSTGSGELLVSLPVTSFRGYSFIPIEIHPFAYDGDRSLIVTREAILRIEILGETTRHTPGETDELADVILDQLINPSDAKYWYQELRPAINYADFGLSDWWVRIETDKDGLFKISPSQLSSLPLADIDPRSFRLFTTGGAVISSVVVQPGPAFVETAIQVIGESDGAFDSSDYIVFFGTDRNGLEQNLNVGTGHYNNPYSQNTVYWLTFGGEFSGSPKRMTVSSPETSWDQSINSYTETLRMDEERYRRDIHGFDWYMTRFFGYNTADYQFTINLENVDTTKAQALSFSIIQENIDSFTTHNMSVYINDVPIVSSTTTGSIIFTWSATSEYLFNKMVTGFVNGPNTLKIRILRSGTVNYFLDYIKLDYGRTLIKQAGQFFIRVPSEYPLQKVKYNLTGDYNGTSLYKINSLDNIDVIPLQSDYYVTMGAANIPQFILKPQELYTPASISLYQVPDLVTNLSQVDNVIICPAEFAGSAQTLSDLYMQVYGKRSLVVDQQQIFDQFNGGHPDPMALRQYLRFVYHNAPSPRLSSLTLLGIGTIDWVNTSGLASERNKVILFQRNDDVSDDWFGMLTTSSYPEIAIGRYPVRNQTELNIMLNNFRSYTQNPQPGWWQNSMVFLADDLYNGPNSPYEDIHTDDMNQAAGMMNRSVLIDKIFAWDYPYDEFQNKPGARDAMFTALNDGRLIWYYIGHGSYDKLGAEDYMNGATDMGRFTNQGKQSFFIAASCKVANFDYWGFDSLAQKVVLRNNTASIASWAATRITYPTLNDDLMKLALDRMVNKRNPVGNAILSAKVSYTLDSTNELVYVLLGDPLLHIMPPERDSTMSVTGVGEDKSSLRSRQIALVNGRFSTEGLNGEAELVVYDTDRLYNLDNVHVSQRGTKLFRGKVQVQNSQFSGGFIVPDDVTNGTTGIVMAYFWDPSVKKGYVSYHSPLSLSDEAMAVINDSAPTIGLYLESLDFRAGDTVGSTPELIARISDANGINITGSSGHNILLVIDDAIQPVSVTNYFAYNVNSYTDGTLVYTLPELAEGPHALQLIAFDGFNLPAVATTNFVVHKSGELSLERFLIYPNPMETETAFTFLLSDAANLKISVYTVTGKKLRTLESNGREGFNTVKWDGKDDQGHRPANGTYFVKIKATDSTGKSTEKTERLVIYK